MYISITFLHPSILTQIRAGPMTAPNLALDQLDPGFDNDAIPI
jgi:hypothetical protein